MAKNTANPATRTKPPANRPSNHVTHRNQSLEMGDQIMSKEQEIKKQETRLFILIISSIGLIIFQEPLLGILDRLLEPVVWTINQLSLLAVIGVGGVMTLSFGYGMISIMLKVESWRQERAQTSQSLAKVKVIEAEAQQRVTIVQPVKPGYGLFSNVDLVGHIVPTLGSQPASALLPMPVDGLNQDWLTDFTLNGGYHFEILGPTGFGKSTIAKNMATIFIKDRVAEHYLINPKHIASKGWNIEPFCTDIKDVINALKQVIGLMIKRKDDPAYNQETSHTIIVYIDEWDWIYSVYKNKALDLARQLIKVGRELNILCIFMGQSHLVKGRGFDTSDQLNMATVLLGPTALNYLDYYKGDDKDRLKEALKAVKDERFAITIDRHSHHTVRVVPELDDRSVPMIQNKRDLLTDPNGPTQGTHEAIGSDPAEQPIWEILNLEPQDKIYQYLFWCHTNGDDILGAGFGWKKLRKILKLTGPNMKIVAWVSSAKAEILKEKPE